MVNNVFSIQQVFSERFFTIPDYQRGYAWEVDPHCTELIEDIELLPENFNHYTGTFVIKEGKESIISSDGNSYKCFEIVDGQQRLTSIIILLSSLRDQFHKVPKLKSLKDGLINNYLYSERLDDSSPLYKLTLNRDCKEFFFDRILNPSSKSLSGPTILSHKRLLGAKKYFDTYCTDKQKKFKVESEYHTWLKTLHNKITQQLKFTIYEVEKSSEVGVIFEVMNNRGKELTELEKVKNYLLYVTSKLTVETKESLADSINKTWSEIFECFMAAGLGADSENQLLRANWLFGYDYNKREWIGSKSIKAKFNLKDYQKKDLILFKELTKYVQLLKDSAIAFADLENPERDIAFNSIEDVKQRKKVKEISIKLKRTKTLASFRPLLLACRLKYPNAGKEYHELVELLEIFAFRVYNLEGLRADTGQTSLFKEAYRFFHGETNFDELILEVKKTLLNYSSENKFKESWKFDEEDNNWYSWSSIRYLLYEYEEYLANEQKGHVQYSWDTFSNKDLKDTIEHILPQTADSRYWKANFNKKAHRIYIHDLGNLCLTLNNSVYSNKDFSDKKGKPGQDTPCYANSSLFQERELSKKRDWTVNSIKDRRKKLNDWAIQRWSVDFTGVTEEEDFIEEDGEPTSND